MSQLQLLNELMSHKYQALGVAEQYGTVDGAHHKQWVIDQMVRALLDYDYDQWRNDYAILTGTEWDEGIAP